MRISNVMACNVLCTPLDFYTDISIEKLKAVGVSSCKEFEFMRWKDNKRDNCVYFGNYKI